MSDKQFDRAGVASITESTGSCLVVTRPQRRQAPGQDGGFDLRVQAVVMAFISDFYGPSRSSRPKT